MAKTPNTDANSPAPTSNSADDQVGVFLTKDALIELLREARRDPDLEAKVNAEARRVAIRRDQMIQIAKADEAAKKARQASCAHRKPNGEETSGGQEFSDGRVRIFCLRCQKTLRSYWSPEFAKGMALARKMEELGVTEEDLNAAMEMEGEGDPRRDQPDDFSLSVPRGVHKPSLTT
jgi:hypothetical protein